MITVRQIHLGLVVNVHFSLLQNHPKLASELKTCPFNARHLIPKHELSLHIATCVDRKSVSLDECKPCFMMAIWFTFKAFSRLSYLK